MDNLHEQYIVDHNGKRNAIILPYEKWKKVIEELAELEDIRQYDFAKKQPSDTLPFDEAIKNLE